MYSVNASHTVILTHCNMSDIYDHFEFIYNFSEVQYTDLLGVKSDQIDLNTYTSLPGSGYFLTLQI